MIPTSQDQKSTLLKPGEIAALMIVVHWGRVGPTLSLIESARATKHFTHLHILILSNDPEEEHHRKLCLRATRTPNLRVIQSTANRGYFGGARFAFDQYLAEGNDLPDWVIVCNHDILIRDEDFFARLLREDPQAVGVIAPRILVWPSNLDQNPFMRHRPGWLRWAQLRILSSNYQLAAIRYWLWRRKAGVRSWLAERRRESNANTDCRQSIYAPHGSFFIFSRKYFEVGGYLDGNLFLYGEEISVAEICWRLGLPIVYEPSLCVHHNEHQSTGKAFSRRKYECEKQALRYVTSQYLAAADKSLGPSQPDLCQ